MQNYTEIQSTETLANSLSLILNNDKTIMSCNSGTAFPTTDLQVGMLCHRTNAPTVSGGLYQLVDLTPTWKMIVDFSKTPIHSEEVAASYLSKINNLSDLNNVSTARTNLGLGTLATMSTAPIANGGTGATTAANARTNLGLGSVSTLNTVPVTNGGTGATDAATARTNLGLGTAATVNTGTASGQIPVVQADGKLPSSVISANYLPLTGGTVTGAIKGVGDGNTTTGFQVADGRDLAAIFAKTAAAGATSVAYSGTGYVTAGAIANGVLTLTRTAASYCSYCSFCWYCDCNCINWG